MALSWKLIWVNLTMYCSMRAVWKQRSLKNAYPDNLYLFKRTFEGPYLQAVIPAFKAEKRRTARCRNHEKTRCQHEAKARKINKKQRVGLPDDPKGQYVYLRLFKDIPQEDLEMMFPNTQVQAAPVRQIKLGVTAGGRHRRWCCRSSRQDCHGHCSRQPHRSGSCCFRGCRRGFSPGHERFQHPYKICHEAGAKAVFPLSCQ